LHSIVVPNLCQFLVIHVAQRLSAPHVAAWENIAIVMDIDRPLPQVVAGISSYLNLWRTWNSDTFELHLIFLDADLIDARNIPHSPEIIHFAGVIFQTNHLNDRECIGFEFLFHPQEYQNLVARFFELRAFTIFFVALLGCSVESEDQIVQTRLENFAVALRIVHCAVRGDSDANVAIAAELYHFEDSW